MQIVSSKLNEIKKQSELQSWWDPINKPDDQNKKHKHKTKETRSKYRKERKQENLKKGERVERESKPQSNDDEYKEFF